MKEFKNLSNLQHFICKQINFLTKCCLLGVSLAFLPSLSASENQNKLTPVDSVLPMLAGLFVILLVIFGLAYLFKRFSNFSPSSKNIKIIETQMIGTKEKLLIVKVQNQNFLIGVTPHSINQLGELDLSSESALEASDPQSTQDNQLTKKSPNFKSVFSNIVKNSLGVKVTNDDIKKLAS